MAETKKRKPYTRTKLPSRSVQKHMADVSKVLEEDTKLPAGAEGKLTPQQRISFHNIHLGYGRLLVAVDRRPKPDKSKLADSLF